jgi:hypothetical protein
MTSVNVYYFSRHLRQISFCASLIAMLMEFGYRVRVALVSEAEHANLTAGILSQSGAENDRLAN